MAQRPQPPQRNADQRPRERPVALWQRRKIWMRARAVELFVERPLPAQHAVEHPTESAHAILAYIGKCKHLGCTVGWNGALGAAKPEVGKEDYDGDGINDGRILCPCHQGQYDIHDLCKNQPGTPPPAPLDVIRFNVGNISADVPNKVPAASNAIVGAELIPQNKYRDADLDAKAGNTAFKMSTQAAVLGAK